FEIAAGAVLRFVRREAGGVGVGFGEVVDGVEQAGDFVEIDVGDGLAASVSALGGDDGQAHFFGVAGGVFELDSGDGDGGAFLAVNFANFGVAFDDDGVLAKLEGFEAG